MRGFGYTVLGPKGNIVAIVGDGSTRPTEEHKKDAVAIAAVPNVLQALAEAEAYFGDRPAKDEGAREAHRAIYEAMILAGVPVVDE